MKTLKSLHLENFHFKHYGRNRKFNVDMVLPVGDTLDEITYYQINDANRYCYCQLIISLNIFLEQDNSGLGRKGLDRDEYKTTKWPDHEWSRFKDKVKEQAKFWDKRFWFTVNYDALHLPEYKAVEKDLAYFISVKPGEPGYSSSENSVRSCPRTIECRFLLNLVDSMKDAHSHVYATYIVDSDSGKPETVEYQTLRSNYNHWDNGDIFLGSYGQSAVAHEIGHNIGLMHEGVVTNYEPCVHKSRYWYQYIPVFHYLFESAKPDFDAQACYKGPSKMDIMGSGNEVNDFDALPWQKAFRAITGIPYHNYTVRTFPLVSHSFKTINVDSVRWKDLTSQL